MNLQLRLLQEGALHVSPLPTLFEAEGYECEEIDCDTYTLYRFKADRSDYIKQLKAVYQKGKQKVDWL